MYFDPDDHPDLDPDQEQPFGVSPTPADVRWILAEAKECHETQQGEAAWNAAVHFPLLHKAIYGPTREKQLIGTMPWYVIILTSITSVYESQLY